MAMKERFEGHFPSVNRVYQFEILNSDSEKCLLQLRMR